MQTYLKTRPIWSQALIFLSLVASGLLIFVTLGSMAAMKATGLSLAQLQNLESWNGTDARYAVFLRIMLAAQFIGVFLLPAWVFAYLSDPAPKQYLGLRKAPLSFFIAGAVLLVAAIPLVEYLGFLNQKVAFPKGIETWMKRTEKEAQQQISMLLQKRSLSNLLLNIVMVAGFAGIGEELFFRGVLQRLFIWGFKKVWIGIVLSAFLFSALHLQFYGFVPRFLLGILLGVIYWYSGSLWPAIFAHFFYDALLITLAYFHPQMITDQQASLIPSSAMVVMALVSAAVTAAALLYMRRASTADELRFQQERSLYTQPLIREEPDGIK